VNGMTKKEAQELFSKAVRIFITLTDVGEENGNKFPLLMIWVEDQEDKTYPVYCEESKYWCESVRAYRVEDCLKSDRGIELLLDIGISSPDLYKVIELWNEKYNW